jgi:hypothetical protein
MNFAALHAFFAVFNGILAVVLMILGTLDSNIFQKVIGFILAVSSAVSTSMIINKRNE